jgi:hypothetical protein
MATFTNDKYAVLSVIRATIVVALMVIAAPVAFSPVPRRAAALAACWATHIGPSLYERGTRVRPCFGDDPCVRDASGGESR